MNDSLHKRAAEEMTILQQQVIETAIAYREAMLEINGGTWSDLVRGQLEDNAQMLYAAMTHAIDDLTESDRQKIKK